MTATIVAISTGPAAGAIGIVRLSGSDALRIAQTVVRAVPWPPAPRLATWARFCVDGQTLDEGLVLFFAGPRSATGEDVVELHGHGAPVVLGLILQALVRAGARIARPGEFTRRAVGNGRVDLIQAEAIAQLVDAESEAQVVAAAAQLQGALSARLTECFDAVADVRADVEGALDFPDEADGAEALIGDKLHRANQVVSALVTDASRGAVVRRGARVVFYGPPNAGKSTLFNRLLGEERALVDEEPGTTRDVLEAKVRWNGLSLTLVDTAGLRAGAGRIEALGIARAEAAVRSADIAVLIRPIDATEDALLAWRALATPASLLEVVGRADQLAPNTTALAAMAVSGLSGQGVEALRTRVLERLGAGQAHASAVTSERQTEALHTAQEHLVAAEAALTAAPLEVVAGELGLAVDALAQLLGRDADEALLDAVFARFCIGK
jgi:tRNA modification GTPase